MLFHHSRGAYVRISRAATRLLPLLDGSRTGEELVSQLSGQARHDREVFTESLVRFLDGLREAQLLTVPPEPLRGRRRFLAFASRTHMPRLALTRFPGRVLAPPARWLHGVPDRVLAGTLLGLLLLSVGLTGLALATAAPLPLRVAPIPIVALLILQVVCHETAHALVCEYLGAPVREAGVALLFYFMPVAYVDRTDAYRLRSRWARAAIALAGPASDLLWTGAYSTLLLLTGSPVAHLLAFFNLFIFVFNLNPLLPTDGWSALEALAGGLNFRQRAMGYLLHRVTGVEMPSSLRGVSRGQAAAYLGFAILFLCYVALLLVATGANIVYAVTSLLP